MQLLNNFDIIILMIVGISSFLAFSRGFLKEMLSVLGWVLIIIVTLLLIPVVNSFVSQYVDNVAFVSVIVLIFILTIMFFFWLFFTKKITESIRESKLGYLDRFFGFIYGLLRGIFLIVLFNILINWVAPKSQQADAFKDSVYFQMAGKIGEPLEKLIPESTLANIHKKTSIEALIEEIDEEKEDLFDKLAQPKIEKSNEKAEELKEDFDNLLKGFSEN